MINGEMTTAVPTRLVIRVKFEIGDIHESTVLMEIHHVRIHASEVQNEFSKSPDRQMVSYLQEQHKFTADKTLSLYDTIRYLDQSFVMLLIG